MGIRVSAREAAELVDRNERQVREWVRVGKLHAEPEGPRRRAPGRVGPSRWQIDVEELARVPGVTLDRERLAALEATRSAGHVRTSGGLLARLEALEREVQALRARLRVVELGTSPLAGAAPVAPVARTGAASGPSAWEPASYRPSAYEALGARPGGPEARAGGGDGAPSAGAVRLANFAQAHGVSNGTATSQMRAGVIQTTKLPNPTRPDQWAQWLTPEQQAAAVATWRERGQLGRECPQCPHDGLSRGRDPHASDTRPVGAMPADLERLLGAHAPRESAGSDD